ncbi:unnamed protein product [Peniophora sp. CBMAI 1063]|nr:unnamed protein product [Peniophora sp. CBMAI 1063]
MLSIQYRGSKGDDFKGLSFSSNAEVQRSIRVLRLERDLEDLRLPKLDGLDCVFRSSLGYPLTLEVLYSDCKEGQPSENVFHAFYDHMSEDPRILEDMKIKSVYVYFLPPRTSKLDKLTAPTYVLDRPTSGWRFWFPDKTTPRRVNRALTPQAPRRDWSPASSQRDSPLARSTNTDDRFSPHPPAHNASVAGPSRARATNADEAPLSKMRSPSPSASTSAAVHRAPAAPTGLLDPASISAAIQSLSKIIPPVPEQSVAQASSSTPPVPTEVTDVQATPDTPKPDPHAVNLGHMVELENLRAQLQQSSTQRELQRKRIRELQQELSTERQARLEAEKRLEEERTLLERKRRKVEDMRRERSAPFLAPALVDAFLKTHSIARDI